MTTHQSIGTIRSLTPTLCALFSIEPPSLSSEHPLDAVLSDAHARFQTPITRALVYCPDAIGDHVWERFPEQTSKVAARWQRIRLASIIPPKTPVCYASVFTGGTPEQHGIRRPHRPTLGCDTLFDAMVRARKRVAIATVSGSSIDLLFRGRKLTYFPEAYDAEATARAVELIDATSTTSSSCTTRSTTTRCTARNRSRPSASVRSRTTSPRSRRWRRPWPIAGEVTTAP